MGSLHIKYLTWIIVLCAFCNSSPAKAEDDEDDIESEPTESVELERHDRHHQLMMDHNQKVAGVRAGYHERRDELIHDHQKIIGNHKSTMAFDAKDHHEELVEDHEMANDMIGRPSEEESPNPGEPVIP